MTNPLPRRAPKIALHVLITPDAKATVDRHATARDFSQARAADELIILGMLAYHMTTGVITMETFRRTVLMMGIPVFLPDDTTPLPEWLTEVMTADQDECGETGTHLVGPVCSACASPIPVHDIPLCTDCRFNLDPNSPDPCGTEPMFPPDQP